MFLTRHNLLFCELDKEGEKDEVEIFPLKRVESSEGKAEGFFVNSQRPLSGQRANMNERPRKVGGNKGLE